MSVYKILIHNYSTTRLREVQNLEAVIDTILCLIRSYHFQSRTDIALPDLVKHIYAPNLPGF